jgi:hypothetical protein
MTPGTADRILSRLALHFAARRDALATVALFGNRFEEWVKWESAIALHFASFLDDDNRIGSIAVEWDGRCDLFVGRNEWPEPEAHDDDVWIELKVRCTADKGPLDLAVAVRADLARLEQRKAERKGTAVALALILASRRSPDAVDGWAKSVSEQLPNPSVRRIFAESTENPNRVLAAFMAWEA